MSPRSSSQLFPARAARFGAGTDPDAFRFCVATGLINNCCVRLITVGLGSTGASSASEAPPPWSALSVPVYSLATAAPPGAAAGDSASRASMNITTYCCPVTIAPSRRFAVALYTHTATARNALATGRGVLQILRQQHKSLVPLLGKQSAHDVDKLEAVQKQGFGIVNRHGAPTLADAYGVVALKIVSVETAGDHHLALCEVVAHETLAGEGEPLYTADLPKP